MRRTVAAILMASMLALAGCSTALDSGSGTGTVNFYVSDQPGAMEDFDHLNVTVTEVTFVSADGNETTKDANETVDLTRLDGANSSLVEQYDVESGDYEKVFLSIGEINGTLENGDSATVKLPSERLQLNQNFTVGDGEDVDFVYDIMVTKAGDSGKYVLRPVASESGTDVPIERVDDDEMDDGDDSDDGDDAPDVAAEFVGNVTAGENATVSVTSGDEPVEGATVTYDGTDYTTNADGEVTFAVPEDAEEVEVTVEHDGAETELETDANAAASENGNASYGFSVLA